MQKTVLRLEHGRVSRDIDTAEADAEILLGPFDYVHIVYGNWITIGKDYDLYELKFDKEGFVFYDGLFYSDMVIFNTDDGKGEFQKFNQSKAPL